MRRTSKFFVQFVKLASPFWHGEHKTLNRNLLFALIILTIMQVGVAVVITEWSAGLFNALDRHSMPGLAKYVGLIVLIFIVNIGITVAHLTIKRQLQLNWRDWLTNRLIGQWMSNGHHYLVTHLQGPDAYQHDNPDGRIAEDARIATEYAVDLCHSLFYCLLLLLSFTKILWSLSGTIVLNLWIIEIPIYGHLVWIALIYAASASVMGWLIGKPLIKATDTRQTEEANFRFGLVKARENSLAIALIQGEDNEKQHFHGLFSGIVNAWQQQTKAWVNIQMFTAGYSVLSMAFPILVSSPRYILGSITLGGLMQSAQSFQQMAAALSWPVDNMARVAEWRASVERVLSLHKALDEIEQKIIHPDPHRIHLEIGNDTSLHFDGLCLTRLDGIVCLPCMNETIKPGERILFDGNTFTGSKLFKAIAGLWPWGEGRIALPNDATMFFMPPRPYLPTGRLRAAICYPLAADGYSQQNLESALLLAGVGDLTELLDTEDNWEKSLAREQQQRLGMVRLLLQQPKWILMQEAFDSLSPEGEMTMLRLICTKLPGSTLLTVTNQPTAEAFHQRKITLC